VVVDVTDARFVVVSEVVFCVVIVVVWEGAAGVVDDAVVFCPQPAITTTDKTVQITNAANLFLILLIV
jgi:hypothetical protein